MSQEQEQKAQKLGDVIDQARRVYEEHEEAHHKKRTRYFYELAQDTMAKRRAGEVWRVACIFQIIMKDPDTELPMVGVWTVTMIQEAEKISVSNLVFQDCTHEECPGHLLRIAQESLVRIEQLNAATVEESQ